MVKLTVSVSVRCAQCDLELSVFHDGESIYVEPCGSCFDVEREVGYDAGYKKGKEDASCASE